MVKQMVVMTVITKLSATLNCCTKTSNYPSRLLREIEPATDMDLRGDITRILTVKLKAYLTANYVDNVSKINNEFFMILMVIVMNS